MKARVNLDKPAVYEYIIYELMRDPARLTTEEAERTIREWTEGKVLDPRRADALLRAYDQTKAAVLYGGLK